MQITTEIIESHNPCKSGIDNFKTHYPNFDGTLLDILKLDKIPYNDKIWLAVKVLDRTTLIK